MLGPKPANKILLIMFNYNFLVLKNAKIAIFGRLRGPNIVEKLQFFRNWTFFIISYPNPKAFKQNRKKVSNETP